MERPSNRVIRCVLGLSVCTCIASAGEASRLDFTARQCDTMHGAFTKGAVSRPAPVLGVN